MRYTHVFFDLDGTLTQSEFGIIKAASYALSKFGIEEPDRDKLLRFIGPPLYYSFDKYYGVPQDKLDEAVEYFREKYDNEGYKDAPVFEGMMQVLADLKEAGADLTIVTSKPEYMADKVVKHSGLDEHFSRIVGPSVEMMSPDKADLIRRAIQVTGADPVKVLMVGDRHYDIDGAVRAGVDSIGVLYGYGTEEELKKAGATYLAETVRDIYRIITETE
ncbi:MAG: HAD hydrolase-like protein [Lachnospiraceae bacterium]|nr:HAD hydrolase-like protein [Lachnospiraceae bacterium]